MQAVPFVGHSEVDVLIIGAGPAGLMCANALANASVNVRIVDQRASRIAAGNGDGISPRTIELLQSYGLAERLLKECCQIHLAAFYNPSSTGGIELTNRTLNVTAPSARYPFEATLNQAAIQDIFLDSMTSLGVEVERSTMPTSIELSKDEDELADPTSYPVRVVLQRFDESEGAQPEEIVHAKFVLGGDGAHSWTRKQFDITMDGEQSDSIWGVMDLVPDTDFPDIRNKCLAQSNHGSLFVIPREKDLIRLYVQLEEKDVIDPVTGRVDKDRMGPDQIFKTAQKSLEPFKLNREGEFLWWTIYSVGQRVASKFSINNRVFIAGDACHTHTPKAGQGMNASINDSHNLAWKIAQVVRGWANMSLLSTYESERRKFTSELIAFDKTWSTLVCGKPLTGQNSGGVSPEQLLKTFQTDFTSGIGIHYHPSIVVNDTYQELAGGLVLGKRVPPYKFMRAADGRPFELQDLLPSDSLFKLLVFTGKFSDPLQQARVESMVADMQKPESFLNRYVTPGSSRFDIITISKGRKDEFNLLRLPALLRPHWSKVFVDDTDPTANFGGEGYSYFGVGSEGALVAVRPDGYVGAIAPLDRAEVLDAYFASFMKIPA
ncbi:FAD binding domain-containing protein [Suillus fuscotomentosus]|uniref:FAD binding domain-containing protein n=1 Tax=Suillus fuscotomentosus TaxID=1912939 RepID=A0AAD4E6N7_9AGAM|nr:FAD binding domain-containing protein [Suillus fuscotomentosus]KAG1900271.1 FAD binding domain-containing protein [Suillus fuscotomentosus]